MNTKVKRIYIIDPNEEVRASYELIINGYEEFKVIGSFSSFEDAKKQYFKNIPDIVLMEINLPGIDGVEATQNLREIHPQVEVVILSGYANDSQIFGSLKAGASGFIIKSSNYLEVLNALKEVSRGGAPMSSRIARTVINNYQVNHDSPLTKREKQILNLIAAGETYTTIAEELSISRETSKTHIRNIYSKLKVNRKAEAIEKAKQERYI